MDHKQRAYQDAESALTDCEDVFTTEAEIPGLVTKYVQMRRDENVAKFEEDYLPYYEDSLANRFKEILSRATERQT